MMDSLLAGTSLPNIHPALVHFPLALLPAALGFEAGFLLRRGREWLERAAVVLYLAAAVTAGLAVRSGEAAANSLVGVPAAAESAIGRHNDWAHRAMYLLIVLAILRVAVFLWRQKQGIEGLHIAHAMAPLLGAIALGLTLFAADLGGALVYRYGLAVAPTVPSETVSGPAAPPNAPGSVEDSLPTDRLVRLQDGSLRWDPTPSDGAILEILASGDGSDEHSPAVRSTSSPDDVLGLTLDVSGRGLLLFGETWDDVRVSARIELLDFEGTVGLVHHMGEADRGWLRLEQGALVLGESRGQKTRTLGTAPVELPGRSFSLAVSALGRHLKGYLDDKTVVHGHTPALPPGRAGLLLDGQGRVRVLEVVLVPLT